jgi:hypothetical protein
MDVDELFFIFSQTAASIISHIAVYKLHF